MTNMKRKIDAVTSIEDLKSSIKCKISPSIDKKELKILRMQMAMMSDNDGDRPIHIAVAQENFSLVQKLCNLMLKTAISIDLTNYLRQTPLHLAVMLGNLKMVNMLLRCGSSLTLRDRNGNSVFHLAVKMNVRKDVLVFILSHPLANSILNSLDHEGYTALHYAVLRRNKMAVECLHRSGADMDAIDGKSGRSPLLHAVLEGSTDMVRHLLQCGARTDAVDYSGRSAYDLALQASSKDVIELIQQKNC